VANGYEFVELHRLIITANRKTCYARPGRARVCSESNAAPPSCLLPGRRIA
jgi:hypothetical protein